MSQANFINSRTQGDYFCEISVTHRWTDGLFPVELVSELHSLLPLRDWNSPPEAKAVKVTNGRPN